jgi:CBS domain-containing protein
MSIARRTADHAAEIAGAPAEKPAPAALDDIVDRSPPTLRRDATLREAADMLIGGGAWGLPVLDAGGRYLGACTMRSIVARCLPVLPDTLAPGAGLSYLRHDIKRLRERLAWEAERPVAELLDIDVPTARESTSLPQLLLILGRRSPLVPIVSDSGRRLLGIATWERAMRALCQAA